jgi:hypothetical protein
MTRLSETAILSGKLNKALFLPESNVIKLFYVCLYVCLCFFMFYVCEAKVRCFPKSGATREGFNVTRKYNTMLETNTLAYSRKVYITQKVL